MLTFHDRGEDFDQIVKVEVVHAESQPQCVLAASSLLTNMRIFKCVLDSIGLMDDYKNTCQKLDSGGEPENETLTIPIRLVSYENFLKCLDYSKKWNNHCRAQSEKAIQEEFMEEPIEEKSDDLFRDIRGPVKKAPKKDPPEPTWHGLKEEKISAVLETMEYSNCLGFEELYNACKETMVDFLFENSEREIIEKFEIHDTSMFDRNLNDAFEKQWGRFLRTDFSSKVFNELYEKRIESNPPPEKEARRWENWEREMTFKY